LKALKKTTFIWLSLLLLSTSIILTAQTWFSFEMNVNDDALRLQSFDGFSAFAFAAPIFGVIGTAIVLVPLSSRNSARPLLASAGSFAMLLAVLLAVALDQQDYSGLASELETATGIAQAHGLEGAKVSLLWPAFAAPLVLFLLAAFLWAGLFISSGWAERKSQSKTKKLAPNDSIGLWDSQR
jgi:hypothetical protein